MKRTAARHRTSPKPPIAWHEDEYAALQANATNRYDDRISEDLFDSEGERREVDSIVQRMIHEAN